MMGFTHFVASQFRRPSGWVGKTVMGRVFDRLNHRINDLAVDQMRVQPGDHVLDVGFGGGATFPRLSALASSGKTYSLDSSLAMVEQATRRFRPLIESGRLDLRLGDAASLPYADGTFAGIITVNTIYSWSDPLPILAELNRALRSGGRLVVAFRSREKMPKMKRWVADSRLYEPEEVAELLEQAGFARTRVEHRDRHLKVDSVVAISINSSSGQST